MEINSESRDKLKSQILNSYGKICYSLTSHEKEIHHLTKVEKIIKFSQIILSAISAGSIITSILGQEFWAQIIASILSVLLLILNSITLKFYISSDINRHSNATNKLWIVREEYLSVLTDFDDLELEDIREKRNKLLLKTSEIYSGSPKTSSKSYTETQKALKEDEEQFFSEEELDLLLPPALRSISDKKND